MFVISDSEFENDDKEEKKGDKKLEATYKNFDKSCDEVLPKKMTESFKTLAKIGGMRRIL